VAILSGSRHYVRDDEKKTQKYLPKDEEDFHISKKGLKKIFLRWLSPKFIIFLIVNDEPIRRGDPVWIASLRSR
jgi:hypothetical protein